MLEMDDVSLSVPADPEFVHLLRTVAASFGSTMQLSFDDIEDLRLAVTESAGYLLSRSGTGGTLTMRLQPDGDGVAAEISRDGVPGGPAVAIGESTFAWQVLAALTDDLRITGDGSGSSIRFTKVPLSSR